MVKPLAPLKGMSKASFQTGFNVLGCSSVWKR